MKKYVCNLCGYVYDEALFVELARKSSPRTDLMGGAAGNSTVPLFI